MIKIETSNIKVKALTVMAQEIDLDLYTPQELDQILTERFDKWFEDRNKWLSQSN